MIMIIIIIFIIRAIRWDIVIIFFSSIFFSSTIYFRGNQTLLIDKSIFRTLLIILSILIIFLINQSSFSYFELKNKYKLYVLNLIIIIIILNICFYSINFISFYFFFEIIVIPTFFIILGWGYSTERIQAGTYLFLYTLIASLPFLIFLILLNNKTRSLIFDFINFNRLEINKIIWILIRLVFIVKIPIFLIHIWLPKAHVEAPVSGSIILAGILLKLGRYGFVKSFIVEKIKFINNEIILFSIRIIGTILIRITCIRQNDLKCLVAYSSISHINIIIIAILSLNWFRLKRRIIIIIAHGLRSSRIFFILNIFYSSIKSRRILIIKRLLIKSSIISFWWIVICCLNISCPPSINFLSEIIIIISIFSYNYFRTLLLLIILIIRGIYSILLFTRANQGNQVFKYLFKEISLNNNLILLAHIFYSFFLALTIFII